MKKICGAKNRQGEPCQKSPIKGRSRCAFHGGKTPQGAASPNFKHGRYSQHLPTALLPSFEAALADPDLLSLKAEIALSQARMEQIIENAQGNPSKLDWAALMDSMEAKRRLHDSESKRLQMMNQFLSIEQMLGLLSSFAVQMKTLVADDEIPRAEIIPRMQRILSLMLHGSTAQNTDTEQLPCNR